jgi:hypothetical protein
MLPAPPSRHSLPLAAAVALFIAPALIAPTLVAQQLVMGPPDVNVVPTTTLAEGSLQPGAPLEVRIARNKVMSSRAWLLVGWSELYAPLQGGVLVPQPDLLVGLLSIGTEELLTATLPASVPAGFSFTMQAWFIPWSGALQFAATSGLRGVVQ